MKVLVLHVPAGSGHQRASEAVVSAIEHLKLPVQATLLDALQGANQFYRWCFIQGYLHLIQHAPLLWGIAYHATDIRLFKRWVQWLHRFSNRMHGSELEKYLMEHQPDVVVGTHFLPMEVAGALKARGKLRSRLVTVITDYMPHALWVAPGIDEYVVASEASKKEMMLRGIPEPKLHVLGIPVDPKFKQSGDRPSNARRLGLDPHRFTVLIVSGGAGTGPMIPLIQTLTKTVEPMQLIVVTGKNTSLFQALEALRHKIPHPMRIFGFVNNMDELMDISDVIVTKPGGLTCAEALIKSLPMVLVNPIPGQESRNGRMLAALGAAVNVQRLSEVPKVLERLRSDPNKLESMRRAGRPMSFPNAAVDVTKLALDGQV